MAYYRVLTYALQTVAAISLFLTLLLPWHSEWGTGLAILNIALKDYVEYGWNPILAQRLFGLHWWLLWIVPVVCIAFTLRSALGAIFSFDNQYSRSKHWALLLGAEGIILAWFGLAFLAQIRFGFGSAVSSSSLLAALVWVEFSLPPLTPEEEYLESLPPNHPDRLRKEEFIVCPDCHEINFPDARFCPYCGANLHESSQ